MPYTPYYLAIATARKYIGNTAAQNIEADADDAAAMFADSSINSKIGAPIPTTSIHFGKAVGIAYLLYKVQRQHGNETEKQRKLDWDICTMALTDLQTDMIASGELQLLVGTTAQIEGGAIGSEYETSPLNKNGKITYGARTRHGVGTVSLEDATATTIV